MIRLWKNFRINLMYWRFRHITRNRLRLQSWWNRRRQPVLAYRPRGAAAFVYRRSTRKTWLLVLALVAVLTAITVAGHRSPLSPTLIYVLQAVVIAGAMYWAIRRL